MTAKKSPGGSPLLEAAQSFEAELSSYAQLSEAFQRAPLASAKQLERANETLGQIAASEQRLGAIGQRLAQAVGEVREQQDRLARATLDRVPAVKKRMEDLRTLLAQFEALGKEASALNEQAVALGRRQADSPSPSAAVKELIAHMLTLSERAHQLANQARAADFEELANRAHALHQQLLSGHNKLKLVVLG
jgi:ABC-type transporter Mla subunit MlaD